MKPNRFLTVAAVYAATSLPLVSFAHAQDVAPTPARPPATVPTTAPAAAPATAPADAGPADTLEALTESVQALTKEIRTLPAERAVARWVEAYDRFAKIEHARREAAKAAGERFSGAFGRGSVLDQLMDALPSPAAWDALARAIDARPPAKTDAPDAAQAKANQDAGNWEWGAPDAAVRIVASTSFVDATPACGCSCTSWRTTSRPSRWTSRRSRHF